MRSPGAPLPNGLGGVQGHIGKFPRPYLYLKTSLATISLQFSSQVSHHPMELVQFASVGLVGEDLSFLTITERIDFASDRVKAFIVPLLKIILIHWWIPKAVANASMLIDGEGANPIRHGGYLLTVLFFDKHCCQCGTAPAFMSCGTVEPATFSTFTRSYDLRGF